ncbi:hypothetical protein G4B88_016935 [Cannabis sativa]|uniref:Uncharacterized protein n=1 Tax=Cannabis sativa TaxID=3483 RepID=A0A7J6FME0_CANSA|nr:hypothetical protein G4B88_016935 [Cannabis sativa]
MWVCSKTSEIEDELQGVMIEKSGWWRGVEEKRKWSPWEMGLLASVSDWRLFLFTNSGVLDDCYHNKAKLLLLWFRMFRRPLLIFGVFNRDRDGHSLPAKERSRVQILQDSVRISVNGAFKNGHAAAGMVVVDIMVCSKGCLWKNPLLLMSSRVRCVGYWQRAKFFLHFDTISQNCSVTGSSGVPFHIINPKWLTESKMNNLFEEGGYATALQCTQFQSWRLKAMLLLDMLNEPVQGPNAAGALSVLTASLIRVASVAMVMQAKGIERLIEDDRHRVEPARETQPNPAAAKGDRGHSELPISTA